MKSKISPAYILIGILLLIIAIFIITQTGKEVKQIELQDKCSQFQGSIINTIKDDSACRIICRAQCQALDFEFRESIFGIGASGSCNSCSCSCEK